jgi:hypothetical protein
MTVAEMLYLGTALAMFVAGMYLTRKPKDKRPK